MIFFIPGEFLAAITFPGVVIHEISHQFMCDIFNIPVYEVRYFIVGSQQAGHVIHEKTTCAWKTFAIGFAPLFINSLLCIIFTFPLMATQYVTGELALTCFNALPFWVGISCGANAFPSDQDVKSVLDVIKENQQRKLLIKLACYIMMIFNILSRVWFNFIYAFLLSLIIPYLLFGVTYGIT